MKGIGSQKVWKILPREKLKYHSRKEDKRETFLILPIEKDLGIELAAVKRQTSHRPDSYKNVALEKAYGDII